MSLRRQMQVESLEDRRMLATFTVTNLLDAPVTAAGQLPGSLRQAIFDANALVGTDEIEFAGVSGSISLTAGELVISDDVTIEGPGNALLTIDASGNDPTPETNDGDGSRLFRVDDGDAENAINVAISGLTLTGGDVAGDGGAISNVESLTLSQSVITGNATGGFRNEPYGNDAFGFSGGGIWSDGVLTVVDSQITTNAASQSGESLYSDRSRGGDGGGIAALGTLTISGSLLATNSAGQGGGVNGRGGHGGAIWFDGSSLTITDSTISGNTSGDGGGTFGGESGHGGGIYAEGSVSLDDVLLQDNQVGTASMRYAGGSGGGMWAAGEIEISNSSISGNSAGDSAASSPYEIGGNGGDGGGLFLGSAATIINSTIAGNNAGDGGRTQGTTSGHGGAGGGIRSSGTLTILASTISGNRSGEGGGTFAYGKGGRGGAGGGIFAGGNLVMHESSVVGNSTGNGRGVSYGASPGGEGGGIAVLGAVTIHGSTISGNTTGQGGAGGEADGGAGGGIWLSGSSPKQITNSTVSGNTTGRGGADGRRSYAGNGGDGGGIFITGAGVLTLSHSTITGNTTGLNGPESYGYLGYGGGSLGNGGGIFASTAAVNLNNTIVARNTRGNTDDDDLKGAGSFAPTYSLIGVDTGATITPGTGNQIGTSGTPVDPLLGTLADNGGPTLTHALLPGSPAIHAGNPAFTSPPDYDQRGTGYDRVANGRIDMGAFETQASVSLPGDFNDDGAVTGRDFLTWQRGESPDPFSSDDLETWQEEYGGGTLSALTAIIEDEGVEDDQETSVSLMLGNSYVSFAAPPAEAGSQGGFDENELFVESVDLAIEQLNTVTHYGMREFGDFVVRRKVSPRFAVH